MIRLREGLLAMLRMAWDRLDQDVMPLLCAAVGGERDVPKSIVLFKKKKKQGPGGKKFAKCLAVISKVATFAIAIQK